MKELTPLFKLLRTQGLDARQGFMCCGGCAGAAIANEYRAKLKADPKFRTRGFVFFHKQDAPEKRKRGLPLPVSLRFGPVEATGDGFDFNGPRVKPLKTVGLPRKTIGKMLAEACKAVGLDFDWNEDPGQVVYVFPWGRPEGWKRQL